MALDAEQIIKKCFDSTKNALRISGCAGSLTGQLTWTTGLGAITHVLGPTDQNLTISGNANRDIQLSTSGTGHARISAAGGYIEVEDSADTIGVDGSLRFVGAQTLYGDTNQNLTVTAQGTGHLLLSATGGTITVNDDGAGITVTAAANGAATLSTSGTGHATVSTANNTLTVNDDAATGIVTSGHLHVGGLFVTDAAQVIETAVMQAGVANVITVAATDHFIGVDCSGAAKAVNLEAAATAGVGRVLIIKDQSGNAGANNITVTPSGAEKIDEAATYVIAANYGSVTLVCTGTAGNEWSIV